MTTAIVFSKNRACQLDLLLRSIEENAPDLFDEVHVIWKGEGSYADAYQTCQDENLTTVFLREHDLRADTLELVMWADPYVAFLMDDCVFYRPVEVDPAAVLEDEDVLCFSPRLGLNTTECYSLRRSQTAPEFVYDISGELVWDWTDGAECDWSYPASLDGHIWRRDELLPLLRDVPDWKSPNTVEASVAERVGQVERPLMASHWQSSLVGVPVNRVGPTHDGNRFGETHGCDADELNGAYLVGKRIRLDSIESGRVNAAHVEFPLRMT